MPANVPLRLVMLCSVVFTSMGYAQSRASHGGGAKPPEVSGPPTTVQALDTAQEVNLAGAFIFTDSKKTSWYKITNELYSQAKAIDECGKLGLVLPSATQIETMKAEISAAALKDRRLQISAWTETGYSPNPERCMVFTVAPNGLVSLAHAGRDNFGGVVCVSK